MRATGRNRLRDKRVSWSSKWPPSSARFDRILCGAAIWQLRPLADTFERAAHLLKPGGALCFNVPALYLGIPDEPGGGQDPRLLALPALLADGRLADDEPCEPLPSVETIETSLGQQGWISVRWEGTYRFTQEAYRDWMKIPVLTDTLLAGTDPQERARTLDELFQELDAKSWKREHWIGWTAWR